MNTMSTRRTRHRWLLAIGAAAALFCGTAARASDVHWSIGISAPIHHHGAVGTVIASGPVHYGHVVPAPVYYGPPAYVVRPAPTVVYRGDGHGHRHWARHDHRHGGHGHHRGDHGHRVHGGHHRGHH
jgi:hypothetical protein